MPPDSGTLAVIGGGVIGLSVARRAAQAGWSVRVHRSGQPGASWVAAGMLAPHSEGWPGEERLLQLGLESLRLWQQGGFTDGLPGQVITARESLAVAVDRADVADLRTVADWLSAQGHPVVWESAVRDVEPMLAQGIRHGFRAPTELAVDNRALLDGLSAACEQLGVDWDGPVADLNAVQADAVVIANGIDAPALWPGLPIRPVKGEVLRLRWRKGCMPLPQRVIRARVHGRQVYVVPRADGVVVGATQYEHGRDTAPTVSGVRDLLDDACTVMPALGEYELAECIAGLRPMTPDNLPLVGRLDARTLIAAGHGRSGFLLAPWTAEQIVSELIPVGVAHMIFRQRRCSRWVPPPRRGEGVPQRLQEEWRMIIRVNADDLEVDDHTTVAALLQSLGYPDRGIAVAVDQAVLPRSSWATALSDGANIEVVTAVQGG